MDWRRVFSPPFVVAAALLLAAVLGLQSAVYAFQLFLMKQPVALRQKLYLIPDEFGTYKRIDDVRLSKEVEEELGTKDYISRFYRDTTLPEGSPGSRIRLHVAYYTGTPETAPHVPDICYVAGGAKPLEKSIQTIELSGPRYYRERDGTLMGIEEQRQEPVRVPSKEVPLRVFRFSRDESGDDSAVVYFFVCNGRFLATPDEVRLQVLDLRSRYAYWCKVEVLPQQTPGSEASVAVAEKFLSEAMPQILRCLPDWDEVMKRSGDGAGARGSPETR